MLYWDNAATTPMYEEVIDSMTEVMRTYYGNPSSLHRLGVEAERLVNRARETIAAALACSPEELRFTAGGSESNNLAIFGVARQYRSRGNHLITTQIEHASVYDSFRQLELEGFRVTYLPVDANGKVDINELEAALTEETILVSVMYVNNEVGSIQPIAEIGKLLEGRPKTLFHVDAVQAVGKLPVQPKELKVDLLSCSAHKLRGPKGTGFLYVRRGVELATLIYGGGQEQGVRSGTENVPSIVGMAKAVRMAVQEQPSFAERTAAIRQALVQCIERTPGLYLSGSADGTNMASWIVHFTFPGMKSEVVVHALEQHDIYVSTRSACSSGASKPSRVLAAMGYEPDRAVGGIRLSFNLQHSIADAERFCLVLQQVVEELSHTVQTEGRRS
jgi:cysteine desulfurase